MCDNFNFKLYSGGNVLTTSDSCLIVVVSESSFQDVISTLSAFSRTLCEISLANSNKLSGVSLKLKEDAKGSTA